MINPKETLSSYRIEELPTWSEIYNEFYLKGYFLDSNNFGSKEMWTALNPIYGIPHYKYLISTVCNQFNKTLFEDKEKDKIIDELNKFGIIEIKNLKFICHKMNNTDIVIGDTIPPIYTMTYDMVNRININTIDDFIFNIVIESDKGFMEVNDSMDNSDLFNNILDAMLHKYIDYFESSKYEVECNGNEECTGDCNMCKTK